MNDNFWKILALAVLATVLFFLLGGRFNVISTVLGTILLLLLLSQRPAPGASTIDRGAWAAIFGLILLLAAGRLLEPIWYRLPFYFTRELLVSWMLLAVPGWWLSRSPRGAS